MEELMERALEEDPLNPMRGVLYGMLAGLAMWAAILLPIWFFTR